MSPPLQLTWSRSMCSPGIFQAQDSAKKLPADFTGGAAGMLQVNACVCSF